MIRTGHFLQICSLEEIENVPISFLHRSSQTPHRAAAVCCEDYCFTYVRAETCAGAPAARVEYRRAHAGLDEVTLQRANKWDLRDASGINLQLSLYLLWVFEKDV